MTRLGQKFLESLGPAIGLERDQLSEMITAKAHSDEVSRHRATVIISRVQVVSTVFAILVPLWTLVDLILFDWPINGLLITARLLSSIVFFVLAWPWNTVKTMGLAYVMLATMLAVPPLFYLALMPMFEGMELGPTQLLIVQAYALLPFVVVAGLSVFPLTAFESVTHSLPVFLITAITAASTDNFHWDAYISNIWLMLLIIGVSLLSGMSQLHYIISLVNRASLDPLTGAQSRRAGLETIDLQYRVAEMQQTNCALAFVDIDDFKSINDSHGHDTGDKILAAVANTLKSHLRSGDELIRWGGEEFVIVLGASDITGVRIVVQRILSAGFGTRPDGRPLTASIGVAEKNNDHTKDFKDLVSRADHRMYRAKLWGKNCCVLWDDSVLTKDGVEILDLNYHRYPSDSATNQSRLHRKRLGKMRRRIML